MGINHGGTHITVPQKLLNSAYIIAAFQQMRAVVSKKPKIRSTCGQGGAHIQAFRFFPIPQLSSLIGKKLS
jgi:hypothetical protein